MPLHGNTSSHITKTSNLKAASRHRNTLFYDIMTSASLFALDDYSACPCYHNLSQLSSFKCYGHQPLRSPTGRATMDPLVGSSGRIPPASALEFHGAHTSWAPRSVHTRMVFPPWEGGILLQYARAGGTIYLEDLYDLLRGSTGHLPTRIVMGSTGHIPTGSAMGSTGHIPTGSAMGSHWVRTSWICSGVRVCSRSDTVRTPPFSALSDSYRGTSISCSLHTDRRAVSCIVVYET